MGKFILKRTVNTKDHLVIFDFDCTIKKHSPGYTLGVAHLFPGKEIPRELLSILTDNPNRREGWEKCLAAVMQELNKLNLSKEAVVEGYANDGSLIEEMDKVVKTFHKDHDVIIVSDGTRPSIEEFMKKYNLHPYLKDILAKPYVITGNGQIILEGTPTEWTIGKPCDIGCFKTCKAEMIKFFKKNKNYKTTTYVGDGKNDLCPVLDLKREDRVFARKDYSLLPLLTNGEYDVNATITSWKTGKDILDALLSFKIPQV